MTLFKKYRSFALSEPATMRLCTKTLYPVSFQQLVQYKLIVYVAVLLYTIGSLCFLFHCRRSRQGGQILWKRECFDSVKITMMFMQLICDVNFTE